MWGSKDSVRTTDSRVSSILRGERQILSGGERLLMKRTTVAYAVMMALVIAVGVLSVRGLDTAAAQARSAITTTPLEVPKFKVDPAWPKVPSKWQLGIVSSSNADSEGNVWVLQRPLTLPAEEKSKAAPPVLEFNAAGDFLQAWGGPGQGYRVARHRARHLRGPAGVCVDWRQRERRQSAAQVHERRKVPDADRPLEAEQGQL